MVGGFSGRCVGVWHGTGIEINGFCFFCFPFPLGAAFGGGGGSKLVSKRARALTTTIGGCFLPQIISNSINGRAPFSLFFLFFFLLCLLFSFSFAPVSSSIALRFLDT